MAATIKWMKTITDKIIFPLLVAAIIGLFGMYSRLQAVEIKQDNIDKLDKKVSKILCIMGERSECQI